MARKWYDEAVVIRALSGDKSVLHRDMTPERVEIVRRALRRGWTTTEITQVTGIAKPERYYENRRVG